MTVDTKLRLLRAADAVMRRDGARALTLEAVAAEAGVSKGGLLYHFATKQHLVAAMLAERWSSFSTSVEGAADTGAGVLGAYVALCADDPGDRLDTALLAASLEDPHVARASHAVMDDLHGMVLQDMADPVLATIVRLASDGLWLGELLGIQPLSKEEREAVVARLGWLAAQAATEAGTEQVP